MRDRGRGRERWCTESCHWCENSMDGSQTLEAIFTSSAKSDRLPPPAPSRISAALSHEHTSLFLHFIPARSSRYCSSKYPNNMLFFQNLDVSVSLAWWGWKWHQMAVWFATQCACNMFCYERSGKCEQIQTMIRVLGFCFFCFFLAGAAGNFFRVSSLCFMLVVCRPSCPEKKLCKNRTGTLCKEPKSAENNLH